MHHAQIPRRVALACALLLALLLKACELLVVLMCLPVTTLLMALLRLDQTFRPSTPAPPPASQRTAQHAWPIWMACLLRPQQPASAVPGCSPAPQDSTLLMRAVASGQAMLVQRVLRVPRAARQLLWANRDGETALSLAAADPGGRAEIVELLLRQGRAAEQLAHRNGAGLTPLMCAVMRGSEPVVSRLLSRLPDHQVRLKLVLGCRGKGGQAHMHVMLAAYAVMRGSEPVMHAPAAEHQVRLFTWGLGQPPAPRDRSHPAPNALAPTLQGNQLITYLCPPPLLPSTYVVSSPSLPGHRQEPQHRQHRPALRSPDLSRGTCSC